MSAPASAHPYRQQLPSNINGQHQKMNGAVSAPPQPSAQSSAYYASKRLADPATTTASASSYHSVNSSPLSQSQYANQSNVPRSALSSSSMNMNQMQQYDMTPPPKSQGEMSYPSSPSSIKSQQRAQSNGFNPGVPSHVANSEVSSYKDSAEELSLELPPPPPIMIGPRAESAPGSPKLEAQIAEPPQTPVGARSFSLPPQMQESFRAGHQATRSASPASSALELPVTQGGKHNRQTKSVDLSHMYLLDRSESSHFTLASESLSDVSQNLIRQYLGEHSSSTLLPRMKTIEMYRKNVKKSNDPKVLFQYAQYMLQTALTMDQQKPSADANGSDPSLEKNMKKQFLKEAVHYLKKLADKGYTDSQYLLADAYSSGALGKVDNKEAFTLFQGAAKHGHIESAYRTAYCYEEGLGVTRDSRRAIEFLKYAASKNHPAAMYKLGVYSFYSRMGLPDNVNVKKSGIQWLTRAVTQANELTNAAPYELGKIYEEGFLDIVLPDHKYAMELFVQAASLGHVKSSAILGKAYELGDEVVPQDADLSIHYYTQAAIGGDVDSMLALCGWYLVGNPPNLEKDPYEAFQWALRAAKLGLPKAQSTVGHFFEKGMGCEQSMESAKHWYTVAMENGEERAKVKLAKLNNPTLAETPSSNGSNSSIMNSADILPQGNSKKDKKKSKKDKKDKDDKDCVIM